MLAQIRMLRFVLGVFITMLALSGLTHSAGAQPAGLGGPVILMGLDPELTPGTNPNHGTALQHCLMVSALLDNVQNDGSGILVIGRTSGRVVQYWSQDIQSCIPIADRHPVTFLQSPAHIEAVSFSDNGSGVPWAMIGVSSSQFQLSPSEGVSPQMNAALIERRFDLADFVNGGGGLLGMTQDGFGSSSWGYVAPLGEITAEQILESDAVVTPEGEQLGLNQADWDRWCCYHEVFTEHPDFFDVLLKRPMLGPFPDFPLAIGGLNVVLPGAIQLNPADSTNQILPGAEHTVTALVIDSDLSPLEGEEVDFEIFDGPNEGLTHSGLSDENGEVSFTYESNLEEGTDVIQASFTDGLGILRTVTALKTWELVPVTISFEKQWVDPDDNPLPARDATVLANGELVCEETECTGTVTLNPGEDFTVLELDQAEWESITGTGDFTAPWENATHIIVNRVLAGEIDLTPAEATNQILPGAEHTATALVQTSSGSALDETTVNFEIIAGPNTGQSGTGMTTAGGEASFTYETNLEEGTDTIQASFTDILGVLRTTTAAKTWELVPVTINFEKHWVDGDGIVMPAHNVTVLANGETVCDDSAACSGALVINPGESYAVEEVPAAGWDTQSGTGTFVAPWEDALHVVVNLVLPGQISLDPEAATTEITPGASHTVTALLQDSNDLPLENVLVGFSVTSGPNAGVTGNGVTNESGETTFTYVGIGDEGTDTIEASFFDALGELRTATATNTWEIVAITISFEKQWLDTEGNLLAARNTTVTANGEVVCEDGDCSGTLEINPGENYVVEESGPDGWQAISGVGEFTADDEDFTHVIVNQAQMQCVDLIAGQSIVAGEVCVINDDDHLTVSYTTSGGWMLAQTHLAVSTDVPGGGEWLEKEWQNRPSNPSPGKFTHSSSHDPSIGDSQTYQILLAEITDGASPGDALYFAAHAVVRHPNYGQESAWGEGDRFVERGNWAMYFDHTVR